MTLHKIVYHITLPVQLHIFVRNVYSPNYYCNNFGKIIALSITNRNIRYFRFLQFDIKLIEILLFLKIQNVIIVQASNLSSIPSLIKLETNSFIINKMNLPTIQLNYHIILHLILLSIILKYLFV